MPGKNRVNVDAEAASHSNQFTLVKRKSIEGFNCIVKDEFCMILLEGEMHGKPRNCVSHVGPIFYERPSMRGPSDQQP